MNRKLTCFIIDDEYLAQEILEDYIARIPFLEHKGSFISPMEAASELQQQRPDILFLDINMPDIDGLSFIPMLTYKPSIILTTAYDHHAIKAFELEVKDYLLKPFPFERFYKTVFRLYQEQSEKIRPENQEIIQPEKNYIFLKVGHRIQNLAIADILFIEATGDYLQVHTSREKILTLLSFASFEKMLPPHSFSRVHRSFMVAIDKIEHIEKNRIKIGAHMIPISETYAKPFYTKLNRQ